MFSWVRSIVITSQIPAISRFAAFMNNGFSVIITCIMPAISRYSMLPNHSAPVVITHLIPAISRTESKGGMTNYVVSVKMYCNYMSNACYQQAMHERINRCVIVITSLIPAISRYKLHGLHRDQL